MNTEDQIKLIGLDKLVALDRLRVIIPRFHITGSISLLWYGVISRAVGDIDIVVEHKPYLELSRLRDEPPSALYDDQTHVQFRVDNVNVCAFYSEREETKEIDLFGVKHRIAHPIHSILAKQSYVDQLNSYLFLTKEQKARRDKHQKDIDAFISWCNP